MQAWTRCQRCLNDSASLCGNHEGDETEKGLRWTPHTLLLSCRAPCTHTQPEAAALDQYWLLSEVTGIAAVACRCLYWSAGAVGMFNFLSVFQHLSGECAGWCFNTTGCGWELDLFSSDTSYKLVNDWSALALVYFLRLCLCDGCFKERVSLCVKVTVSSHTKPQSLRDCRGIYIILAAQNNDRNSIKLCWDQLNFDCEQPCISVWPHQHTCVCNGENKKRRRNLAPFLSFFVLFSSFTAHHTQGHLFTCDLVGAFSH